LCGTADGPCGAQPPSDKGISWPPSHGRRLEALRPACELHDHRDFRMPTDRRKNRPQRLFGHIVEEAQIAGRDATFGLDGSRLDAQHAGPR